MKRAKVRGLPIEISLALMLTGNCKAATPWEMELRNQMRTGLRQWVDTRVTDLIFALNISRWREHGFNSL
jgi:hypothetical protein